MPDKTEKPIADDAAADAAPDDAPDETAGAAEATDADAGDFHVTGPADPDDPTSNRSPRFSAADPALMERFIEMRQRSIAAIGETVLAMSAAPRYRDQTLEDLRHLVLEPLMRDRIAIATTRRVSKDEQPLAPMTGVAIWATVSDEVDARIRQQVKAGSFPIRLKPGDWISGDHAWLLDVIAPNRSLSTAVVANFRQVCRTDRINIHPVVARMVEPEVLAQLVSGRMAADSARKRPRSAERGEAASETGATAPKGGNGKAGATNGAAPDGGGGDD